MKTVADLVTPSGLPNASWEGLPSSRLIWRMRSAIDSMFIESILLDLIKSFLDLQVQYALLFWA